MTAVNKKKHNRPKGQAQNSAKTTGVKKCGRKRGQKGESFPGTKKKKHKWGKNAGGEVSGAVGESKIRNTLVFCQNDQ